jgi:hypothetical protein
MYVFDGGRHWSDAADDDGSSGMGAICMANLGREWHRCDVYSCGCHIFRALCMALLDGGGGAQRCKLVRERKMAMIEQLPGQGETGFNRSQRKTAQTS